MAEKEYIEKQAAIELLRDNINLPIDSGTARAYWTRVVEIKDALIGHISKIPAADVAPVVHAEWIPSPGGINPIKCRRCGTVAPYRRELDFTHDIGLYPYKANYCPNCGAKMDGGKNEEI